MSVAAVVIAAGTVGVVLLRGPGGPGGAGIGPGGSPETGEAGPVVTGDASAAGNGGSAANVAAGGVSRDVETGSRVRVGSATGGETTVAGAGSANGGASAGASAGSRLPGRSGAAATEGVMGAAGGTDAGMDAATEKQLARLRQLRQDAMYRLPTSYRVDLLKRSGDAALEPTGEQRDQLKEIEASMRVKAREALEGLMAEQAALVEEMQALYRKRAAIEQGLDAEYRAQLQGIMTSDQMGVIEGRTRVIFKAPEVADPAADED